MILEALPKLSAEERWEIRAKLNELDDEAPSDNGELSEQEKAIIEARLAGRSASELSLHGPSKHIRAAHGARTGGGRT